jgi:hypothetical protein
MVDFLSEQEVEVLWENLEEDEVNRNVDAITAVYTHGLFEVKWSSVPREGYIRRVYLPKSLFSGTSV